MMQTALKHTLASRALLNRAAPQQLVAAQRMGFAGKDIKFGTDAR